jgi:hypothetical protein
VWAFGVAVAALGGAALGAAPASPVNQALQVSGTLTYAWHGDPSRGCAAEGLCGARGSMIVHFDGYANLFAVGRRGSVSLNGASATVRVRREDPGLPTGECVDVLSIDNFGIRLDRLRGRQYIAAVDSTPASAGRCAGPLARELSKVHLSAWRLRTGALGFDLRGQASLVGGPFSGELISTLVLRPDTVDLTGSSTSFSSSAGGTPPRPRVRTVLVEYARVRYRIVGASGALATSFVGDPAPVCETLDSCGVSGLLGLSVSSYRGTLDVVASRTVTRRVGRTRALADLRSGRLALDYAQLLDSKLRASMTETMTRPGEVPCRDTTAPPITLVVNPFGFQGRSGGPTFVVGGSDNTIDPLRTHCPGPSMVDVTNGPQFFGPGPSGNPLAQGSIAEKGLGLRQISVALSDSGRFAGAGYSGTRDGLLRFSLTLLHTTGGTRRERRLGG